MEIARVHLRPAAIPFWETLALDDANAVGAISLPADAPDKPYKANRGSAWVTQVRVGTTTRDATNAEEARLYMQAAGTSGTTASRRPARHSRISTCDAS